MAATLPIAVFTVPVMGLRTPRAGAWSWGPWRLRSPNTLLVLRLEVGETLEGETVREKEMKERE